MAASISVIIPTYNHARFLPAAVGSARAQGWPGLEIIVVDDGSTDDTQRVLSDLAGDDLRSITQTRSGAAAARNRAIKESRGEFVAFLDADDYWLPGKLEAQMRVFELGSRDRVFVYCGSLIVDDKGDTIDARPAAGSDLLLGKLVWENVLTTGSLIIKRSALFDVGMFDESLDTLGEDWDLWLRLAMRYEGACVPDPLVAIRYRYFHDKYRVRTFEASTRRVLSRLFDTLRGQRDLGRLARRENQIMSWHESVLAKNYLECGERLSFLRCAARSVMSDPIRSWYYLAPGRIFGRRFKGSPALGRK